MMETRTESKPEGVERDHVEKRSAGWRPVAGLVLLLLVYIAFLSHYYAPAISHPDANGYWGQGTLIAETGRATFRPESPVQYIGMHWLLTDSGVYVCRYPPGLPLAVALVSRLFGPEASVLLNPILAVATLLGVFFLTRVLVGPGWGVLAALTLTLNPVFNVHALNSISHMAVAALLVWGVYLLVCWSMHGRLSEAFGAGVLLGCIPTVRYPEALFVLGFASFLLWHWRTWPRTWLHCLVAGGGALLPITPLLVRNQRVFGAFWRTGYSLTHEETGFGWNYFRQHWLQYIQSLLGEGMGVLLPLAILAITLMISLPRSAFAEDEGGRRARLFRPFGVLTALLVVPTMLLYMAYYWGGMGGAGGSMRFLLPLFPVLSVCAMWALWLLTRRLARVPRVAAVTVILLVYALWGVPTSMQECGAMAYQQRILARTTAALRTNVLAGSVVLANQGILQHLDFIRSWRLANLPLASEGRMRGPLRAGDDDMPRPMQADQRQAQMARYEGLSGAALERAIADDMRTWSQGRDIYFVGTESELQSMAGRYFNRQNFEIVARVDLPKPPQELGMFATRGMPGMGRMGPMGGPPGMGGPAGIGGPPGMAGPQRMGGRPPMGGGMGIGSLQGERQLVIAKWTPVERPPAASDRSLDGAYPPMSPTQSRPWRAEQKASESSTTSSVSRAHLNWLSGLRPGQVPSWLGATFGSRFSNKDRRSTFQEGAAGGRLNRTC